MSWQGARRAHGSPTQPTSNTASARKEPRSDLIFQFRDTSYYTLFPLYGDPMSWEQTADYPLRSGHHIRRYIGPNGLKIILLADHSAPILSYQTWFQVGSRDEQPGQTGIAHLFEHLMFNETESLPVGAFDRLIENAGGDSNAATWVDWTHYRTSLPSRDLELAVRLESERMHRLKLGEKQLESEREVVANERMLRVEDDIDGFLDEELFRLAFTTHPYHWPTIGWMDDIRHLDLDAIRTFYRRHYTPNNATIVLVGDFDEAHVLSLVAQYYGAIDPGKLPHRTYPAEPEQTSERQKLFKKPVTTDHLVIGYKSPPQLHPDWSVLEFVYTLLLGSGPSSPIFRNLVIEKELASSVSGGIFPFCDPGLFAVSVVATSHASWRQILAEIDTTIALFADAPVAHELLEKVRNCVETDFWSSFTSADSKGELLGHFETTSQDFRNAFQIAQRLQQISAIDIQKAIQTYLIPNQRSSVIAIPNGN